MYFFTSVTNTLTIFLYKRFRRKRRVKWSGAESCVCVLLPTDRPSYSSDPSRDSFRSFHLPHVHCIQSCRVFRELSCAVLLMVPQWGIDNLATAHFHFCLPFCIQPEILFIANVYMSIYNISSFSSEFIRYTDRTSQTLVNVEVFFLCLVFVAVAIREAWERKSVGFFSVQFYLYLGYDSAKTNLCRNISAIGGYWKRKFRIHVAIFTYH